MKEWDGPYNPFNSMKALVFRDRFEGIRNGRLYPPAVLNLDVTGVCQYKCIWCHHRRKQVKSQPMPHLDKRLADTLPYFLSHWKTDGRGVEAICIVGSRGDALCYPGLDNLLRNLHFAGQDIGLVSNGYGFTEHLIHSALAYSKFIGISMDAGTKETYLKLHQCPNDGFDVVTKNISTMTDIVRQEGLRNDIGYKFLILPQNQSEVFTACQLAKDLGVRYVQIRPADLPEEARRLIDVDSVNVQIAKAMTILNEPGVFEIAGVRHKFTPDLKKILPSYCYLTALTVTVTSDGRAWPCVDRRCDEPTLLADCSKVGWKALEEVWGSVKHLDILHNVINCGGKGPQCNIRCSNYGYDVLFRDVFSDKDVMDIRLI